MKTIGITDFKALVNKCLENPGEFNGKTILLWNADYMQYGIAYRVVEQCCIEYNKKSSDRQVWHEYSDFTFKKDDITKVKVCCTRDDMYGFKNQGVLFNTGCFVQSDLNDWLTFINKHSNEKGQLSPDWVLIACAQADSYGLDERQFSTNCEIYNIQPSVEEWKKWVSEFNSQDVLAPIVAYIEEKKPSISFDQWQRIMDALDMRLSNKENESLKQIGESEFDRVLGGSVPGFPSHELWDFIQSLQV